MEAHTHDTAYHELKVYTFKNETQQELVTNFYTVAIPAYNRAGVKNVGVFTELEPVGQTKLYVLIPYQSIAHFAAVNAQLENDAAYQQEGEFYLKAPPLEPAYERIESSLMQAFKGFPELVVPYKQTRIFELRQYQSPTESAGKKKIEMFNEQGEINIFKRLNFNPVFWGETVIGLQMPNLTYMITFDDLAAKDAQWARFIDDPEWKKISVADGYSNEELLNEIVSTLLIPVAHSQI